MMAKLNSSLLGENLLNYVDKRNVQNFLTFKKDI